jgi:microcystin-dependent protein
VALETATYVPDLVSSNPGHTDGLTQTDSHLRLIKSTLKSTFPNFTSAALNATQAAIDAAIAVVTGTAAHLFPLGSAAAPSITPIGDTDTGIYSAGPNKLDLATAGVKAVEIDASQNVAMTAGLTVAGAATITGAVTAPGAVPIGMPCPWVSDTLPTSAWGTYGWMNGQAISRTTYATLYNILGNVHGAGDGSTTFNLPDWREVVPVGKSTMGGTSARGLLSTVRNALASFFGSDKVTLAQSALPNTTLSISGSVSATGGVSFSSGGSIGPGPAVLGSASGGTNTQSVTSTGTITGGNTSSINGGVTQTQVDVQQPATTCNWIMRLA